MDELTPADRELALLLASGLPRGKAAERAGVAPNTVWRRMCDPKFVAVVEEYRRAIDAGILARLTNRADDAIESLHLMATDAENEATKVRAADLLLAYHLRYSERADVLGRLAKLEEALGVNPGQTPSTGSESEGTGGE